MRRFVSILGVDRDLWLTQIKYCEIMKIIRCVPQVRNINIPKDEILRVIVHVERGRTSARFLDLTLELPFMEASSEERRGVGMHHYSPESHRSCRDLLRIHEIDYILIAGYIQAKGKALCRHQCAKLAQICSRNHCAYSISTRARCKIVENSHYMQ